MLSFHKLNREKVEQFFKFSNDNELLIPIKFIKVKVYRHFIECVTLEFYSLR